MQLLAPPALPVLVRLQSEARKSNEGLLRTAGGAARRPDAQQCAALAAAAV